MAAENEKLKTELVVIGGGGAGLAAALAAAENGCRNIVVFEKASQPARPCTQLRPDRR
jgi:succinate dehydrogenase/fumarate reductase flavoprotein subunit